MKIDQNYVQILFHSFIIILSVGTKCETFNLSLKNSNQNQTENNLENDEIYILKSTISPQSTSFTSTSTLLSSTNTLIPSTTLQLISSRNISQLPLTIAETTTIIINMQNQSPLTSMTTNSLILNESNSSLKPQFTSLTTERTSISATTDANYEGNIANCTETSDENCIIDHNVTCVGEREYCNLTYDEYISLLYDYIYPTTPEWILICSHLVVFIMGLVSLTYNHIIYSVIFFYICINLQSHQ